MSIEELEYRESVLRECFKDKLEDLDVNGSNDMCVVKMVKTYGALWHYTHQLLLAEHQVNNKSNSTTAETMNIQATGLQMRNTK